jgi:hypothetical protein
VKGVTTRRSVSFFYFFSKVKKNPSQRRIFRFAKVACFDASVGGSSLVVVVVVAHCFLCSAKLTCRSLFDRLDHLPYHQKKK